MSFHAALAARIVAALSFAWIASLAAVAAPAWALVMITVAGAGVCMAHRTGALQRNGAHQGWGFFSAGIVGVVVCACVAGAPAALSAIVIWRMAAEGIATENMLRALSRRLPAATIDGGLARVVHLSGGPVFAFALLFGVHGGVVFGQTTFTLPLVWTVLLLAVAMVALLDWLVRRLVDWRLGMTSRALTLHVGGHHALFLGIGLGGHDGAALVIGLLAWRILRFAPPLPGLEESKPVRGPVAMAHRSLQSGALAR